MYRDDEDVVVLAQASHLTDHSFGVPGGDARLVIAGGSGDAGGLSVVPTGDGEDIAYAVTTDVRDVEGSPVRYFTVWIGLVHRYFAASGRPARRGNGVTFLMDGEEAWAATRRSWLEGLGGASAAR